MLKIFVSVLVALLILLAPYRALADSFLKYGIGLSRSAESSASETKMFSLGFRDQLFGGLVYQYEGGMWIDSASKGRMSSAFFDAGIGLEVRSGDLVLRSIHGVAFISTPDSYLGGYFPNFNHDIYVGIKDSNENSIGISYKHISNAGLMPPNVGRNFVSIDLGIPW